MLEMEALQGKTATFLRPKTMEMAPSAMQPRPLYRGAQTRRCCLHPSLLQPQVTFQPADCAPTAESLQSAGSFCFAAFTTRLSFTSSTESTAALPSANT